LLDNNTEQINVHEYLAKPDFFKYRLVTEMQRSERVETTFCVAVLNVTTPKIQSIVYPKDVLTPHITKAIAKTIRNIDVACKDERGDFLILLTEATDEIASMVAKRLLKNISFIENENVETNVSIGIANYPKDSKTYEELLQAAKYAMFQAQQKGKNEVVTITSVRSGLSWEQEAKDALSMTRKKLNTVVETTIKSLLATFATKDEYLEGHSLQVSKISSLLAENVGIKERYTHEITLAALLHDVGYLQIPGSILFKRGYLTPEEKEIIQQHPVIATEKILKPVKSLENMLPIILDHHEHWNGKGYPNKKTERQIHIGARIISIADTYHALISDRPYRRAFDNQEEIIKIFKDGAGTIWEEKLIHAFLELLTNKQIAEILIDRRQ
jgi:diguanylate cyclase (GGDEF)-like protein